MNRSLNKMIKKHTVLSVLTVIAVVMLTFGVSYSIFTTSHKNTSDQTIEIGDFDVSLTSTSGQIIVSDLYPTSVDNIGNNNIYSYTVTNTGDYSVYYTMYLTDYTSQFLQTGTNATTYANYSAVTSSDYPYLMHKFNSGAAASLNSIYDSSSNHFNLGSNTLAPGGTASYTIQFWLSDTSPNTMIGKIIALNINIDAAAMQQSSN